MSDAEVGLDDIEIPTTRDNIIPEGVHTFRVTEGEVRQGGAGLYLNFTTEVAEGGEWDGSKVWVMVSLSPAARWKMIQWLDAHMVPAGDPVSASHFIGKTFRGKVKHETFEGRTRAKVDEFLPASDKSSATRGRGRGRSPGMTAVVVEKETVAETDGEVTADKGLPEDVAKPKRKGF